MKIEKTVCPYCGANMKIQPGQKSAECEYCGSCVIISAAESGDWKDISPVDKRPAEHSAEPAVQKPVRHGIFPPPGFRSRNILHMIIAVCGYLFILSVAASLGSVIDFIFFTIASLSVIDICTDWTGLYSRLKGVNNKDTVPRIIAKVIWSAVIFIAWIVVMVLVEDVLNL